jgi:lysophospholipase L1-like esterase
MFAPQVAIEVMAAAAPEKAAPENAASESAAAESAAPENAVPVDAGGPTFAACPAAGERVLLIGDSLSAGLGPVMQRHADACGTPFHHHGVVGSHVTEWAHWIDAQLERAAPTLVIVSLGGNDFGRFDGERVNAGIVRVIAKVRASQARLLWISPPTMPFGDRVGARAMWQAALAGEPGVDWFPTEQLTIPRARDRVHPTLRGYRSLGATLWQWASSASQHFAGTIAAHGHAGSCAAPDALASSSNGMPSSTSC